MTVLKIRGDDGNFIPVLAIKGEKGDDGVCIEKDGFYFFKIDPDTGHLFLGVTNESSRPPLHIDANGHLIYTID